MCLGFEWVGFGPGFGFGMDGVNGWCGWVIDGGEIGLKLCLLYQDELGGIPGRSRGEEWFNFVGSRNVKRTGIAIGLACLLTAGTVEAKGLRCFGGS
ncbi:MAG: hypothetical protein RIS70_2436 [Planctomycetota bacterium]